MENKLEKGEQYFGYKENVDFAWFSDFVKQTPQYFESCTGMPQFTRHDVEATSTISKKVWSIELKERDKWYSTWYIEPDKLQHLFDEATRLGRRAFYFNKCGDKIYIFNTDRIGEYNPQIVNVKIWNKGKEIYEVVDRYVLPNYISTVYNLKTKQIEL